MKSCQFGNIENFSPALFLDYNFFFSGTKKFCSRNNFCSVFYVLQSKKKIRSVPKIFENVFFEHLLNVFWKHFFFKFFRITPNVCWDAPFFNPFFAAAGSWFKFKFKKKSKNGASQQTFDPSYFVRALERANALTGIFKPHYT